MEIQTSEICQTRLQEQVGWGMVLLEAMCVINILSKFNTQLLHHCDNHVLTARVRDKCKRSGWKRPGR